MDGERGESGSGFRRGDAATLVLLGVHALATAFITFNLPIFLTQELGFTGAEVGVLQAAYFLTSILAALPVGLSSDRQRPRDLLLVALAGLLLGALGVVGLDSFTGMLAAFVALGLSASMMRQVLDALWYRRRAEGAEVGAHFGAFLFVRMASVAVGMVLGGWLLGLLGFRPLLFGLAGTAVGLALVTPFVPDTSLGRFSLGDYARDVLQPRVLFFLFWLFLFASHWGAETTSYARFLREDLHLEYRALGAYMGGELVFLALTSYVLRRAGASRTGAPWLLAVGMFLSGVTHIAMTVPDPLLSFAFRAVHGVGDGIVGIVMYTTVGRLFNVERIGGNAGLTLLVTMLGAAGGALVYGPLGEAYGNAAPLVASGVLGLVLIPLAFVRRWSGPAS